MNININDIKNVQINQKSGYFTFKFNYKTIPYSFYIKQNASNKEGFLANNRTRSGCQILMTNDIIYILLNIVDAYIEHQLELIEEDLKQNPLYKEEKTKYAKRNSLFKYIRKDVRQQKKYYYNILKSNIKKDYEL